MGLLEDIEADDPVTAGGQSLCDGAADATGAAGDECEPCLRHRLPPGGSLSPVPPMPNPRSGAARSAGSPAG